MRRKLILAVCAVTIPFVFGLLSLAQTTTARLSGTVTDETGGVVPGAQVTVSNASTGAQRAVTTDERGRFTVPQLAPGPYQVTVSMAGFETLVRSGITLTVGQEANITLAMKVGAVSEQVTVTGEAPLVDTSGSSVSGLVEEKRIVELPLNGRDFTQLALVQPAVLALRNTDSVVQKGFGARISMAGSRPDQTGWLLDGTNVKSMSNFGTPGSASSLLLGVDAVREFQVLTSNYSAEFGGSSGGVINMVSKSGSNDLHGTAYEFHRNDNLDARNFFDRRKPEFKRNQFGFALGGPIKKDKTFFFGNYEALFERLGLTLVATVPDANVHRGLIPGVSEPVPVAASVRPYLDLWPLPNGGPVGVNSGLASLSSPASDSTNQHFFITRVDHRVTDNQSIFARMTFDQGDKTRPYPIPITNNEIRTRSRYATVQYEKIWTPQFLSNSRVAYSRNNLFSSVSLNIDYPKPLFVFNPGMPPNFIFPGVTQFGPDDRAIFSNVQNLYEFQQNFLYTRQDHSFKFGVNYQKVGLNTDGGPRDNGAFSWASMRAFLEDQTMNNFSVKVPGSSSQRTWVQHVVGLYFQDDWKMRPRFTLNLGLRYEPFTTPVEKWDRIAVVRDWVRATRFDTEEPFWQNPSKRNFSPRVGFAWDPTGDGKTAVRGGFGLFYVVLLGGYYRTPSVKNPPYAAFIEGNATRSNLASAVADVNRIAPTLLTATMTPQSFMEIYQWDLDSSYEMKFNLTVQREFPGDISVALGYLGGRGIHLWRETDANDAPSTLVDGRAFVAPGTPRVNPITGVGTTRYSDAQSFYNGLQVEVKKRFSRGFQFQTSYTWSKTMDDATTGMALTDFNEGATPQAYSPKSDRGLSALHQGQNFVMNGVWSLPAPKDSRAARLALGGWQVSGIFTASAGTPFSAVVSGRHAPDLSRSPGRQRPDLIPGRAFGDLVRPRNPNEYFDASVFVLPPTGFFGNAGRNILVGPGVLNFDFSLTKNTRLGISEGSRLEFRADFFNLFNRANFATPALREVLNPATRQPIAGAGRITRTVTTARQLQFGLKLIF